MKANLSSAFVFYDFIAILSLAITIWGEAQGEPFKGKLAVGWVIRNRVEAARKPFGFGYPGVVLKRKQFSCFNKTLKALRKGKVNKDRVARLLVGLEEAKIGECLEAAECVYHKAREDPTNGAMWFVHKRLKGKKRWMKKLEYVGDIGNHSFYREK